MKEIWDILNKKRELTGRTHIRGEPLKKGDYHLVVEIWIVNHDGKIILSKRHPQKSYPHLWECTGGSVLAGENSITAAKREVLEETGISLEKDHGKIILQYMEEDSFFDVWLFIKDVNIPDTVPQAGEVTEIKYVNQDEMIKMFKTNHMVPKLDYILELLQNDTRLRKNGH
jgi:8-oxo-dGTP diphosphatase